MKIAIALCLIGLVVVLCPACKSESGDNVKVLKETLDVLNDEGVVYSGTVEGPLQAGFELYSGGRVTSGGWVSLRLQSPVSNPMQDAPEAMETPEMPDAESPDAPTSQPAE